MKIVCPSCSAQGNIDETQLPAEGRQVTCPRCAHRFLVRPERSGVDIIQQRERMVCPKCSTDQPLAATCSTCGIAINKYIQAQEHERERERLDFGRLRSETRAVDAWYKDLFDRRLITLVVRILSLLVLLVFFMTCSYNNARRNKLYLERGEEGSSGPKVSPEKVNNDFKERFGTVSDSLAENANACLTQNYNYSTAWYQHNQPYNLTDYMRDNLSTLNRRRAETDSAFRRLPTPSGKYYDCYLKLKTLSNLQGEICGLANAYSTHFPDFHDRVSNLNFELNKTLEEINVCKSTLK